VFYNNNNNNNNNNRAQVWKRKYMYIEMIVNIINTLTFQAALIF